MLLFCVGHAQRVGVVLSGGGATALAHVGFLRSLEENNIPIDYIAGTSMGSVIAALYASGFSVDEIEGFVRSEEFIRMSNGDLPEDYKYFFRSADPSATMATIKYSKGTFITNAIPTNLIDPASMDWSLMSTFSAVDQAANYSFDSLYIPFRCIAADVENKREIVFRNGSLNVALRASSTYPFYLPPRRINGVLLYDGGIYNNFPVDMLYSEFIPDVILGCTVSSENAVPKEGDLLSQLESMIMFRDIMPTLCDEMVVVKPTGESIGTFEFEKVNEAIAIGYMATQDSMASILSKIDRKVSIVERNQRRAAFKARMKPIQIEEIFLNGLENSQKYYIRKMIGKKNPIITLDELRKPYFRLFSDVRIKSIFPEMKFNPATGNFKLNLDVEKEKDLFISFGGNFSSRSINTGFVGLKYNLFGKTGATLSANSYFGRFYASVKGEVKWDLPGSYPVSLSGSFTQNRWDYYKSLATFFDDVKPSFVLLNERVGSLGITTPSGNNAKFTATASYAYMFDEYYQTQQFLSVDTADRTDLESFIFRTTWERSTLNRAQWASSGSYMMISGKYLNGLESTIPGTTSAIRDTVERFHEWWVGRFQYTSYFLSKKKFHAGFHIEAVASTMDFLNNYISSAIMAPAFQPIPESKTFFLPQFRAYNFVSGGLSAVYSINRALDLRVDGYTFAAFGRIVSDELNRASYRSGVVPYYILSSSLILHSPLGPISVSANYYNQKEDPISFLFNFGYIIFNSSARD
ncbi:MAG: patatin-like phospholipase family protein [Flavobacteriales bacterium]